MHDVMAYIDDVTDHYDVYTPTCGSATDTVYHYESPIELAPGSYGHAPCTTTTGWLGLFCERSDVRIDTVALFLENGGLSGDPGRLDYNLHFLVRHETGHNFGFGHNYDFEYPCLPENPMIAGDCGFPLTYDLDFLAYTLHDVLHLNALFP